MSTAAYKRRARAIAALVRAAQRCAKLGLAPLEIVRNAITVEQ